MEGSGVLPSHPYEPKDLHIPGFIPLTLSQLEILGIYGIASSIVVLLTWLISGGKPKKTNIDKILMCWWAFTGLTHLIIEGYFVFSPDLMKDKTANYLAEVWKEYSKGDSRYAVKDSTILAVEGITVVLEGPACLLAVYAIAREKSYRYILQFTISLGQLYGVVIYYITSYLEDVPFAASSYYYYAYYVGANFPWVVIPLLISIRCWKNICTTVQGEGQKKVKVR